jgi:putative zinc finger/helix-turn-helix YgiT family protein
MKPFPWKCLHCRERTVSPAVLPSYEAEMEHDGRPYALTLTDFPVLQCSHCGEILLDDEANQRISDALRDKAGLLSPAEIRQKREALNLTQKQVAGFLQISDSTLSRWETGAQLQQRCMDRFLRSFFDLEALRDYLGVGADESSWPSIGDTVPPVMSRGY